MKNLKDRVKELSGIPEFAIAEDSALNIIPEAWVLRDEVLKVINEEDLEVAAAGYSSSIRVSVDFLHDPSRINISIPTDLPMADFEEELKKALFQGVSFGYRE